MILAIVMFTFGYIALRNAENREPDVSSRSYEERLQRYTSTIQQDPNDPAHYNERGDEYFALEYYENALTDYGKAIELNGE